MAWSWETAEEGAVTAVGSTIGFWAGAALGGPVGALIGGAVGGALFAGGRALWRGESWSDAGLAALRGGVAGLVGGAAGVVGIVGVGGVAALRVGTALAVTPTSLWWAGGATAATRYFMPDGSPRTSGGPGVLPTKEVGHAAFRVRPAPPVGHLLMPDKTKIAPHDPPYPADDVRFWLHPDVETLYDPQLPETVVGWWTSFGDPSRVTPLPGGTISVPAFTSPVPGGHARTLDQYREKSQQLSQAFARFQQLHGDIAALTANTANVSSRGQAAIRGIIETINRKAPEKPPNPKTENDHIMDYIRDAVTAGAGALQQALNTNRGTGSDMDAGTRALEEMRRRLQQLEWRDTDRVDRQDRGIDARLTERDRRLRETDRERSLADMMRRFQEEQQRMQQQAALNQSRQLQQPQYDPRLDPRFNPQQQAATSPALATPNTSPSGLGGMENGLMNPLLLSSLLGGGLGRGGQLGADRNDDRRRDDDRRRRDDERDELREERQRLREEQERLRQERMRDQFEGRDRAVPVPPMVAAAANPPPPPRVDAPQPPGAQPAKNAPPAQGGPVERTPGEDGKVLYTFADGRQQRVLPVVAQALDVACADNAGTNAKAAYQNTPAKWDDDKEIGARVDPNLLMTGDVCGFEKGTAIAVVWGSPDSGGTLEHVVDGKLVPFDPESKAAESLGAFVGFFHPDIGQGSPTTGGEGAAVASPVHDGQLVVAPVG